TGSSSLSRVTPNQRCFKCGSCGNQLDLYASATGLSLFEATLALCEQLHREVPWMLHMSLGPADPYARQTRSRRLEDRRTESIHEGGQTDRAATAEVIPNGPKKWHPF